MDERYLTLLIEECAEVIQAATKVMRFGADHCYPDDHHDFPGMTNERALALEVGDLTELVRLVDLDKAVIALGIQKKRERLKEWGPDSAKERT